MGISSLHVVSLAHNSVVINTSTDIVTAGSGRPVWGQSRMQTHTGSLCRGTEVTSWSPENAWLQGTSGQMSRLPALSGSSACLASLPSYSVAASELPSAPQGGKEKGGARLRGLLFVRVSSPSLLSSQNPRAAAGPGP